jgi:hypothetical protein
MDCPICSGGKEAGLTPDDKWPTFETPPPPFGNTVTFEQRTAQQQMVVNNGIVGSHLATSPQTTIKSNAARLETDYFPRPTLRNAIPITVPRSFTSWIWGEGRGLTRTGMPMTISAPEIRDPAAVCPPVQGQDIRRWPLYPDGTFGGSRGSIGEALLNAFPFPPGGSMYPGNPVVGIAKQIYDSFHPSYSVSATVSGWADLDGDGLPEFVATPSWIERFSLEPSCFDFNNPGNILNLLIQKQTLDAYVARDPNPAISNGKTETHWHTAKLPQSDLPSRTQLALQERPGPPGPVGLPLSYEISTGAPEGFGFTLPIGSLVAASVSSLANMSWIPIAMAAPGLTVDSFAPRTAPGFTLYKSPPSASAILQGLGTSTNVNASGGAIADVITSVMKVNLDLTFITSPSTNRSESRAQLIDLNSDGLPDYLLYDSTDGSLVAYFNSPTGFGARTVINRGFRYSGGIPDVSKIDNDVALISRVSKELTNPVSDVIPFVGPMPADLLCGSLGVATGGLACIPYGIKIIQMVDAAQRVTAAASPLIGAMTDAVPRERGHVGEVNTQSDFLRIVAISLMTPPGPVLGGPLTVDTATAIAHALTKAVGYLGRTVRQLGFPSRINAISRGFSHLDGSRIDQSAFGFAIQTRGFIDLNGDGLPDYVVTNDRESLCHIGEWQVFWGTGTSSLSASRAFLPTHSCVPVPMLSRLPDSVAELQPALISNGFLTLPLNIDIVRRAQTTNASQVDTSISSYVSLNDINRDGRPDIVTVGRRTWSENPHQPVTWYVYLNNGSGFQLEPGLSLDGPYTSRKDVVPASPRAVSLDVSYPAMRTTHTDATVLNTKSRDVTETHAGLVDFDADGSPDVLRRVRIKSAGFEGPERDGLLLWSRRGSGPQDLMIEDRYPMEGQRNVIEYKPASAFQWKNASPDGGPPPEGHTSLVGVATHLVRSVRNERLWGRPEQTTVMGYDYKRPYFDMTTRTATGFAEFSTAPLNSQDGTPLVLAVEQSQLRAQRPNHVAGITHSRVRERLSGVPVREILTSYAEVTTSIVDPKFETPV